MLKARTKCSGMFHFSEQIAFLIILIVDEGWVVLMPFASRPRCLLYTRHVLVAVCNRDKSLVSDPLVVQPLLVKFWHPEGGSLQVLSTHQNHTCP